MSHHADRQGPSRHGISPGVSDVPNCRWAGPLQASSEYCKQAVRSSLRTKRILSRRWDGECFLFPREGHLSWRIPFRGPRDKYLVVRGLSGRRTGGETKMRFHFFEGCWECPPVGILGIRCAHSSKQSVVAASRRPQGRLMYHSMHVDESAGILEGRSCRSMYPKSRNVEDETVGH